jgi:hypothetical protein
MAVDFKHHGILGMQWGVRRYRDSSTGRVIPGKKIPSGKAEQLRKKGGSTPTTSSEDFERSRELKTRGSKSLSNSELKELNNRLQMERSYRDLSRADVTRGIEIVKTVTAVGTAVTSLYALSKTPLVQDVAKVIKVAATKR